MIKLINYRKNKLIYYNDNSFLINLNPEKIKDKLFKSVIKEINKKEYLKYEIEIENNKYIFVYKYLDWDSKFFNKNTFKIYTVLYENENPKGLVKAIRNFVKKVSLRNSYFYFDIPTEDIFLIQCICTAGFRLIESRLHFYYSFSNFKSLDRYKVRFADKNDIKNLRDTAILMRNNFDKYHADYTYSNNKADDYLGKFIENSILGFADFTLIPDDKKLPDAFLSANNPVKVFNYNIAKLVLAAVNNYTRKGWLKKLLYEVIVELKNWNADFLTTITQTANRPAIKVWLDSGFELYSTSHIFVKND